MNWKIFDGIRHTLWEIYGEPYEHDQDITPYKINRGFE